MKKLTALCALLALSLCIYAQQVEGRFSLAYFHEGAKDTFLVNGSIKGSLMHLSIPGTQKKSITEVYIDKEKNTVCLLSTQPDSITVVFNQKDYFKMLEDCYCERPCNVFSFNRQTAKDPKTPMQYYNYQGNGESVLMTVNGDGTLDMIPLLHLLHTEPFIMHLPSPKGSITLLEHISKDAHSYLRCHFTVAKVEEAAFRMPKTTQVMHLENLSVLKDQDKVREFFKGLTSHF